MHYDKRLYRFNLIYFAFFSLLLVLPALAIQKGEEVYLINGWHRPWLDEFFAVITDLGNALCYLPVLICLLFIRFGYAAMLLVTGAAHGIIVTAFKRLLYPDAARPVRLLDPDKLHFVPGVEVCTSMSFPSGHTATAFAFLVLLCLIFNSRFVTILLSVMALAVGVSRIYLLQHYAIDVAFGALIGTATAFITYQAFSYAKAGNWMHRRIHLN